MVSSYLRRCHRPGCWDYNPGVGPIFKTTHLSTRLEMRAESHPMQGRLTLKMSCTLPSCEAFWSSFSISFPMCTCSYTGPVPSLVPLGSFEAGVFSRHHNLVKDLVCQMNLLLEGKEAVPGQETSFAWCNTPDNSKAYASSMPMCLLWATIMRKPPPPWERVFADTLLCTTFYLKRTELNVFFAVLLE